MRDSRAFVGLLLSPALFWFACIGVRYLRDHFCDVNEKLGDLGLETPKLETTLVDLPTDVLVKILGYLDLQSFSRFRQTSNSYYHNSRIFDAFERQHCWGKWLNANQYQFQDNQDLHSIWQHCIHLRRQVNLRKIKNIFTRLARAERVQNLESLVGQDAALAQDLNRLIDGPARNERFYAVFLPSISRLLEKKPLRVILLIR